MWCNFRYFETSISIEFRAPGKFAFDDARMCSNYVRDEDRFKTIPKVISYAEVLRIEHERVR